MELTAFAISRDAKYVATGTQTLNKVNTLNPFTKQWDVIENKDPIRIWNISTGEKVLELGPLRGEPRSLAFGPDNKYLLSCQTDLEKKETVWLWDIDTKQVIEQVQTPLSGSEFFGCAVSPNGRLVAFPVLGSIYLIHLLR